MDRPPGNVAVVTDDAKGIGAATCERLAREGAYVAVDDGDGQRVVDEIIEASGTAVSWHLDVTDEAAVASTLGDVVRAWGRLDVMVNNAGTNADRMFHKMSRDDWFRVVQVDLGSMLNMTRPVINGMRSREYGHIVNVSSVNAQKGQVGRTNYCAAKAGGPASHAPLRWSRRRKTSP